jgi:RNA recognition motif-containing protein
MQVDLDQEKIKSKKADLARTLFVGNVPLQAEVKAVKKVLVQVGIPGKNIVSVRFRSVPINAVNMPRKYAIAQNKLNVDHRASKNAYVCLSDQDALKDALVLLKSKRESLVIDDHHLRFDSAAQKSKEELSKENDRTVFLGNLSFDI